MTTERASFPLVVIHLSKPPMPDSRVTCYQGNAPIGAVDVVDGMQIQTCEPTYLRALAAAFTECADQLDAALGRGVTFQSGDRVYVTGDSNSLVGTVTDPKPWGVCGVRWDNGLTSYYSGNKLTLAEQPAQVPA